jgi:DNA-binding NarL/FixJ family response regulator
LHKPATVNIVQADYASAFKEISMKTSALAVVSFHGRSEGNGRTGAACAHERRIAGDAEESLHLTPRQRDVLSLLCDGLPNKLISRRLGISAATVKTHISSILAELGVMSRLQAVVMAQRLGLHRQARAIRPQVREVTSSDEPRSERDERPVESGPR